MTATGRRRPTWEVPESDLLSRDGRWNGGAGHRIFHTKGQQVKVWKSARDVVQCWPPDRERAGSDLLVVQPVSRPSGGRQSSLPPNPLLRQGVVGCLGVMCGCCGQAIRIMIFKGSGYCCDDCRKRLERGKGD